MKTPQTKQEINRIQNSFLNGNISYEQAKKRLENSVGVNPAVAQTFVNQWRNSLKKKGKSNDS